MSMLRLMDNEAHPQPDQPVSTPMPTPLSNNSGQLPLSQQPPVTLSANSIAIASPPKHSKKILLYIGIPIVILGVLVTVFMVFHKPPGANKNTPTKPLSTQNSNTPHQSSNSNATTPTQNPVTNNGSINSQVQYCSNPVNAELVC